MKTLLLAVTIRDIARAEREGRLDNGALHDYAEMLEQAFQGGK